MITVELSAGLGNRLLALASAIHLATDCGESLEIVWDIGNGFSSTFDTLFTLTQAYPSHNIYRDSAKAHPLLSLRSRSTIHRLHRETTLYLRSGAITALYEAGNGYATLKRLVEIEKHTHIDSYHAFFPNSMPKPGYFSIIQPSATVLSFASQSLSLIDANTYGLHIRRTDHVEAIQNSPTQLFIQQIERILATDSSATFYLATDDPLVTQEFIDTYGPSKIKTQQNITLSRASERGAFCAYTDMLCLSKCKEIYGSSGSTFSLIASLLSGIPLHILTTSSKESNL